MAQRTIHFLLGELLLKQGRLAADGETLRRFRLGNLLPDAYSTETPDRGLRRRTHFVTAVGSTGRISDFERFRLLFPGRVPDDGLYLGYYVHLIEDACFRMYWHSLDISADIRSVEDISFLHRDYHILNHLIVERYGLQDTVRPLDALETEPIMTVYPFRQDLLLDRLQADLADTARGEPRFFTADHAFGFIEYALPLCSKALERALTGRDMPDPLEFMWNTR